MIVEGDKGAINGFIGALRPKQPPMSQIDEIKIRWVTATGEFKGFEVVKSESGGLGLSSIAPPDIALCDDCLREMLDSGDRRFHYPFITCVNCGPRFTIIEELPYDRPRTSMKEFPLCNDCSKEYTDPADRRYHAEPTCCPACGPKMSLYRSTGESVNVADVLRETAKLLDQGGIVAIKGIGGIHVAAKTTSDDVMKRLRELFGRPQQPLAVMSKDLETIRTFAKVNPREAELLISYRRPIVVLKRSDDYLLSELVAPGLDSVGVMLPYSGVHHLILRHGEDPAYVMTSANLPGLPMLIDNQEALAALNGLVDYLLLHDRKIVSRCDDSVVRLTAGEPTFLRRSRGYVPMPLDLKLESNARVLALGAELNVAASLLVGGRCFQSQYIGDVDKVETLEYLREAVAHLMRLLNLDSADVVAHDLHPRYETTAEAKSIAERFGAKTVGVQHHHAHLCSLIAEHELEEMVGIAADGAGYGQDGTIWGGEVMVATPTDFKRVGGLAGQPMPGGDLATRFPARMVAGILWGALDPTEIERTLGEFCPSGFKRGGEEVAVVLRQLERNLNVFQTSSCGRVLDAVACLLGICSERTYEGEPAVKLETVASAGDPEKVRLDPSFKRENGKLVVDTSKLLREVLEARRARTARRDIAAGAQQAIADGLARLAIDAAKLEGVDTIGVSGGVFYNSAVTERVQELVREAGLKFVRHKRVPPGDGGISVGQSLIAASRERST